MSKKDKHIEFKLPENKLPFTAPEGYFDAFPERVMNKIDAEITPAVHFPQKIIRILRPALAMAASFTIIFFLVYLSVRHFGSNVSQDSTANASGEIGYVDNYYLINDRTIYEAFEEDTDESYDEAVVETFLLASVSDIELMELNN